MCRPPNPRLQRTPSALPPSPLSRQPLGDKMRSVLTPSVKSLSQAQEPSAVRTRNEEPA